MVPPPTILPGPQTPADGKRSISLARRVSTEASTGRASEAGGWALITARERPMPYRPQTRSIFVPAAILAAGSFPRRQEMSAPCLTLLDQHDSKPGFIMPTDNNRMKFTNLALFCRAVCMPRVSLALTVTIRIPGNSGRKAMALAPSVTFRNDTTPLHITIIPSHRVVPSARLATCPQPPIWASMLATITRYEYRVPIAV